MECVLFGYRRKLSVCNGCTVKSISMNRFEQLLDFTLAIITQHAICELSLRPRATVHQVVHRISGLIVLTVAQKDMKYL